ncbi:hypothetical protein [Nitratireductor sp. CH_MIT9313-5]|uniref:hypothetical protein n=1 Tax=Nitratireductor sp. CH_MIT9313-5 TaxID=3107764 RepID=UPI0030095297
MRTLASILMAAAMLTAAPAHAQEEQQKLSIELNGVAAVENGCRLTFVASNTLKQDITKAAYEFAIFNSKGLVERLSVLDFQDLPAGRTKVRQFDIGGIACENLSRILVNEAKSCEGASADVCLGQLEASSKADIDFGT